MHSKLFKKEELEKIVKESYSIAECLAKMGKKPYAGNYKTFYRYKEKFNLDTSHFTGRAYMKGKVCHNKKNVSYYEKAKGISIKGSVLLQKLIEEGYKERKCERCQNTEWEGEPIPLQIHHIDGNHYNNEIKNILLLCPNCHAQTDNFCGKNRKIKKEKIKFKKENKRKVEWPSKEKLYILLKENSFIKVGKMYGVSDNAIRKWCEFYGLSRYKKDYK